MNMALFGAQAWKSGGIAGSREEARSAKLATNGLGELGVSGGCGIGSSEEDEGISAVVGVEDFLHLGRQAIANRQKQRQRIGRLAFQK